MRQHDPGSAPQAAAVHVPLTLLSGIYGMNFRYMPELEWRYGYYAVLAFMALVAATMVYWFKRRGWL
jgi:magnesium transporter